MSSLFRSANDKIEELLDTAKNNEIDIGSRKKHSITRTILIFIMGILFVIAIWWLIAEIYNIYFVVSLQFPTPKSVFTQLWSYLSGQNFLRVSIYQHIEASLFRWIKGFAIACMIGLVIGLILASNNSVYEFGIVPVNVMQMIPGLAWLPVTILLFGFGESAAVFIIAIAVISPIAISVATGIRKVPTVNIRVARMSGRSHFEIMTEVLIPFAAIDILNGLRIGMANAWRMLIAAEMVVGVAVGLGFAISQTTSTLDYVSSFVCIVVICAIGLIIDKIFFENIERYMRRKLGFEEAS